MTEPVLVTIDSDALSYLVDELTLAYDYDGIGLDRDYRDALVICTKIASVGDLIGLDWLCKTHMQHVDTSFLLINSKQRCIYFTYWDTEKGVYTYRIWQINTEQDIKDCIGFVNQTPNIEIIAGSYIDSAFNTIVPGQRVLYVEPYLIWYDNQEIHYYDMSRVPVPKEGWSAKWVTLGLIVHENKITTLPDNLGCCYSLTLEGCDKVLSISKPDCPNNKAAYEVKCLCKGVDQTVFLNEDLTLYRETLDLVTDGRDYLNYGEGNA